MACLSMLHSSWPQNHSGIGGTKHLAYYKLPDWFREACLLPEGYQAKAIALLFTPPLPPLSASANLQLPSVCWSSHTKTLPCGIWTRARASLPAWLHGASHYISLDTCQRNAHIFMYSVTSFMCYSDAVTSQIDTVTEGQDLITGHKQTISRTFLWLKYINCSVSLFVNAEFNF